MASKQEQKLHLTLLVDKEKNRVVLAEANGDFIDTLFSFLTLPLGTITRLLFKNEQQQESFGCISNLYKSVENISDEVFFNSICKRMLLYPRNDSESLCEKLKLNVDDSEPTKYFICNTCAEGTGLLSTFVGASCSCGNLMDKEIKLHGGFRNRDGVFVEKQTLYLIFDDLKVFQSFPGNTLHQLQQLGYKNMNKLTHMSVTVGLNEILELLRKALTSDSPLSDVFLTNGKFPYKCIFSSKTPLSNVPTTTNVIMDIKVTISKSKQMIVYAEAERDFVNFLFSFLTAPAGTILEQLNGNYSIGCMNNLNKSVRELHFSCFMIPIYTPTGYPKVAPQFGYVKQPLEKLCEKDTPPYRYCNNGVVYDHSKQKYGSMKLFDPRSSNGTVKSAVGFVKGQSKFIVWDNLQVTTLDKNTSSIAFLQKLKIPFDDLEVHEMSIGETEALNLLGASLTSFEAALTEALFHLIEYPEEEPY
ncbi:uncharacterized protein LOC131606330 [Vicia villosa]|uniref:uncharacterized protein LOC131606330 n=1 Tax=Vicia villosa TaxID=3911 RepID=UPI00273C108B|nr:uncharacterized protein LOC131606330 [Vicia villosa]